MIDSDMRLIRPRNQCLFYPLGVLNLCPPCCTTLASPKHIAPSSLTKPEQQHQQDASSPPAASPQTWNRHGPAAFASRGIGKRGGAGWATPEVDHQPMRSEDLWQLDCEMVGFGGTESSGRWAAVLLGPAWHEKIGILGLKSTDPIHTVA